MDQRVSAMLHSGDENDAVSFSCQSRHDSYILARILIL